MGLAVGAVAIFPCAAGLCSFTCPHPFPSFRNKHNSLSGGEQIKGCSRGGDCWCCGCICAVTEWAGLEGGGPSVKLGSCALSLPLWPLRGPTIGCGMQPGPATW